MSYPKVDCNQFKSRRLKVNFQIVELRGMYKINYVLGFPSKLGYMCYMIAENFMNTLM